jgi:gas vesicle protein
MKSKNLRELKDKIHNQIDDLEDEIALQMLQEAAAVYSSPSKKDILDELTDDQKKRLHDSIQQANDGKTLTNEEVKQKAKEWLSR